MMLPILQFVFSSFWVWAGSVVLLAVVVAGIATAFEGVLKALIFLIRRGD